MEIEPRWEIKLPIPRETLWRYLKHTFPMPPEERKKGINRWSVRRFMRRAIKHLRDNGRSDEIERQLLLWPYKTDDEYKCLIPSEIKRYIRAEKSGKFHDILCPVCKHLIGLSNFLGGKSIRITIPENEHDKYGLECIIIETIFEEKLKAKLPRKTLSSHQSHWKRNAAKRCFGSDHHNAIRDIEKIVKQFNIYTPNEMKELASKELVKDKQ